MNQYHWFQGHRTFSFSTDASKMCTDTSISAWINQRNKCYLSNIIHWINLLKHCKWQNQCLEYLINLINFEFLCRKLIFFNVGIVQNLIFFKKSPRRLEKTLSTLKIYFEVRITEVLWTMSVYFLWKIYDLHGHWCKIIVGWKPNFNITGTKSEIQTVPIHGLTQNHATGRDHCKVMNHWYIYLHK